MSVEKIDKLRSTHDIADILIYLGEIGSKLKVLEDIDLSVIEEGIRKTDQEDLSNIEEFMLDKKRFPQLKDIVNFIVKSTNLDLDPQIVHVHRSKREIIQGILKKLDKQDIKNIKKTISEPSEKKKDKKDDESLHNWFKVIKNM